MNDLSLALNRLRKILLTVYAIALVSSVSMFFVLNYMHHQTLAESFALSARTSLVINDLRQAMFTLNTAVKNNFDSVHFHAQDGTLVFSLPPGQRPEDTLLAIKFEIQLAANPDDPSAGTIGTLTFYQNSWWALRWALLAWACLLVFAIPFSRWGRRLIENRHKELLVLGNAEAKAALARQVAHDIRSPLSALRILENVQGIAAEPRDLLIGAARRIEKIAQDLLDKTLVDEHFTRAPHEIVAQILLEKRAALGPNSLIKIEKGNVSNTTIMISPGVFARVISNLLNNAVESIESSGTVSVEGQVSGTNLVLRISDTGRGIPQRILAEIGKPGFSFGKKNGYGLGLSHAIASVRATGGDVKIESREGAGTVVSITLNTGI